MHHRARSTLLAAAVLVGLVAACGGHESALPPARACSPGQTEKCPCPTGGGTGTAACLDDGSGYGACDGCSHTPPPIDAGDDGAGDDSGGPTNPFISVSGYSLVEAETYVAVAPDGTLGVVWIAISAAGSNIGYTFSHDHGSTWTPPNVVIAPGGRVSSDPVITSDSKGNFYVVWVAFDQGSGGTPVNMAVFVSTSAA